MSQQVSQSKILPMIVRDQAIRNPTSVYLRDNHRAYSYRDVHEQGRLWGSAFNRVGVKKGDRVLVMLPVSVHSVFAWLGVGWIGAVETPINNQYKGQMLNYVIKDSGAKVLIVHEQYLDQIKTATEGIGELETLVVVGGTSGDDKLGNTVPLVAVDNFLDVVVDLPETADAKESDIATIMYTSGTTGPSKGVMVPWAQVEATSRWTIPINDLSERDAYYSPYPLFHIAGKLSVFTMAMVGGRVFLRDRFSTNEFWDDVRTYQCTVAILLGSVANFLYRQPESPDDARNPLEKVLMVPLIPEVEIFKRRFGIKVCTCFNMTEASSPIISPGWDLVNTTSCGRAREGVVCQLVDEEHFPVETGQKGELVLRADSPWTMMSGYLGKPEKTVEATRNQWLHTGDVFFQDEDGNFYFSDRKKDMIRRRGENISSIEVEVEVNSFEGVLECAALGVPSEWGEEDVMVCVVPKQDVTIDPASLHAHLKERLPKFMVPKYIRFLKVLQKTNTQKIQKIQLRDEGVTIDTVSF